MQVGVNALVSDESHEMCPMAGDQDPQAACQDFQNERETRLNREIRTDPSRHERPDCDRNEGS
jgi:hypothetical protein